MKSNSGQPLAINFLAVPLRSKSSSYPESFQEKVSGREKRALGDFFGLRRFGVNLTRLRPSSQSSLFHRHTIQEEFIFVLEGEVTLVTDKGDCILSPGMCAGFPPNGVSHHLINKSDRDVLYLEIGDRIPGDEVIYPQDDLKAVCGENGQWTFTRKDGEAN